ncbi:hypothetical protein HanXRQr2_Chr13g0615571 [Helianthus annuus]|uniref:Uncharacterized protein n=1 Tax=Helianthus annuus TaxID=4232 RepID=A0A251T0Z1_HELAN|nr:hypothetical protein HanXRQr2_Chr13g0615571 [Helianthus annuus]
MLILLLFVLNLYEEFKPLFRLIPDLEINPYRGRSVAIKLSHLLCDLLIVIRMVFSDSDLNLNLLFLMFCQFHYPLLRF